MKNQLSSIKYLDNLKIPYELKEFDTNITKGAESVANFFKMDPKSFLKTLIFQGSSGTLYMCLVGSNQKLNSKVLKMITQEKDINMADEAIIYKELGYKVGSIPPFGLKRKIITYIEISAGNQKKVGVGAGEWGKEIFISLEGLIRATSGRLVDLIGGEGKIDWNSYKIDSQFDLKIVTDYNFGDKINITDLSKYSGKEVSIYGWMFNKRSSGSIHFLQIRDGTGFIQVVAEKNKAGKNIFRKCEEITLESSLKVIGKVRKEDRAPSGFEIDLKDLELIQKATEYPIQKKNHGIEFLLDNRHLWLRSKKQWAIQRIRNTIINAIFSYLNRNGFIKIDAPILTPNACEGTSTLFPVPYLPSWKDSSKGQSLTVGIPNSKENPYVFLSQSGQLYLEAAIFAHQRVFDFGPTFRAEKSKTRRHLTEFWMMDAEAAFVEHKENMKIQENLTVDIVKNVLVKNKNELEILQRDIIFLENSSKGNFEIISHIEAIKLAQKEGFEIGERDDLGADEEAVISKKFDRPFFIEKYPKEVKAFYMKTDPKDTSRDLNDDMLAPEGYGEVIGGSQREDNHNKLVERIREQNLNIKDFEWYLELRKYGSVPHSGFGLGLERYVSWICGLKHIRETIPFPRLIYRLRP